MTTLVNEKIRVAAVFEAGQIRPIVFSWRDRPYKVLQTVFTYAKNVGQDKIFYFSVNTGGAVFELAFNREKLSWEITRIF